LGKKPPLWKLHVPDGVGVGINVGVGVGEGVYVGVGTGVRVGCGVGVNVDGYIVRLTDTV
jgi:hypothetical protein